MASKSSPARENIALPALSEAALKQHDTHATSEPPTLRPTGNPAADAKSVASDASSSTNSSDEFDWNEEDEDNQSTHKNRQVGKARRGRAFWLAFMRLARPVRTLLVGILGAGFFITPLLVFVLRFPDNVAKHHVFMWSLWLSIIWAASCITYLVVDLLPRIIVGTVNLFGGQVETLKRQIEVCGDSPSLFDAIADTRFISSPSPSLVGSNSSWTWSGLGLPSRLFAGYIIHPVDTGLSSTVSCK